MSYYNKALADRAVNFINQLTHVTGKHALTKFRLRPWQEEIVRKIFGSIHEDGKTQWKTVFIMLPRKNGKSTLISSIVLAYNFLLPGYGKQILLAAGSVDQTAPLFDTCQNMIRQNHELNNRCTILAGKRIIKYHKTNSEIQVISTKYAKNKLGKNPNLFCVDELLAQTNRDLLEVLETSQGARDDAMAIYITTASDDKNGVCWEQYCYAKQVLSGEVEDPHYLPIIYEASEDLDWTQESTWAIANPALGDFRSLDEMQRQIKKCKVQPAWEASFRKYYLNQWVAGGENKWITAQYWIDCKDSTYTIDDLKDEPIWAGIDLASTVDLSALAIWQPATKRCWVWQYYPEESAKINAEKDKVPYLQWIAEGWIVATPGIVCRHEYIVNQLIQLKESHQLQTVAIDPWAAPAVYNALEDNWINVRAYPPTFKYQTGPTKSLEAMILAKEFKHPNNPVLNWNAGNATCEYNRNRDVLIKRGGGTAKVDGLKALIMAVGAAEIDLAKPKSAYDSDDESIFL